MRATENCALGGACRPDTTDSANAPIEMKAATVIVRVPRDELQALAKCFLEDPQELVNRTYSSFAGSGGSLRAPISVLIRPIQSSEQDFDRGLRGSSVPS